MKIITSGENSYNCQEGSRIPLADNYLYFPDNIVSCQEGAEMVHNKPHTDETKLKISLKKKGTSPWNKGLPCSDEQKEKISHTLKITGIRPPITHRCGEDSPRFGKIVSEITKLKIKEARKNQVIGRGEKAPYWKGGRKLMFARARHKRRNRGFILLAHKNPYQEPIEFHHIHPSLPFVVYCPTRIHKMFNGHEKSHFQNVNAMLGFRIDQTTFEQLRDELLRLNKKATIETQFYVSLLERII